MNDPLELAVLDQNRRLFACPLVQPIELGRQNLGEPEPNGQIHGHRLIVAPLNESRVSRRHALLEPREDGQIQITNLSKKLPVYLFADGTEIRPAETRTVPLPVHIGLGPLDVRVRRPHVDTPQSGGELLSLDQPSIAPGQLWSESSEFSTRRLQSLAHVDLNSLLGWLRLAMGVLQSAASSEDFFLKAAHAAVNMVELDVAAVFLRERDTWVLKAQAAAKESDRDKPLTPSRRVLSDALVRRTAVCQPPQNYDPQAAGSLSGVEAAVAAPILNREEKVTGVLYGERRQPGRPLGKLEAMLVDLLAFGVAAGLARMEQEAARIRLEQFFTPRLARILEADPQHLAGKEAEVTILCADIRGFSSIAERIGAAKTVAWIGETMSALTDCILERDGVVVDYVGDEILAMWGAPVPQPDQMARACNAAAAMFQQLRQIDARWKSVLNQHTHLGVGINSGVAFVGNVGSHRKFKYGPLGMTVNLASRVQGATKYLNTQVLLAASTAVGLNTSFSCRRIGQARVVNINEPVTLHELPPEVTDDWPLRKELYEAALERFEHRDPAGAMALLEDFLRRFPDDGPANVLLKRAKKFLKIPDSFDPVWELPGK
jgi:adenylate cyclase